MFVQLANFRETLLRAVDELGKLIQFSERSVEIWTWNTQNRNLSNLLSNTFFGGLQQWRDTFNTQKNRTKISVIIFYF